MSGSAGLFNLVGSPKVGGAGDGKHKKKYGHPNGWDDGFYQDNDKDNDRRCPEYSEIFPTGRVDETGQFGDQLRSDGLDRICPERLTQV